MIEVTDYLKVAASNFKTAERHLKDAEDSLRTLSEKLEDCLECMRQMKQDEVDSYIYPDAFICDSQPLEVRELHPVSQ